MLYIHDFLGEIYCDCEQTEMCSILQVNKLGAVQSSIALFYNSYWCARIIKLESYLGELCLLYMCVCVDMRSFDDLFLLQENLRATLLKLYASSGLLRPLSCGKWYD